MGNLHLINPRGNAWQVRRSRVYISVVTDALWPESY